MDFDAVDFDAVDFAAADLSAADLDFDAAAAEAFLPLETDFFCWFCLLDARLVAIVFTLQGNPAPRKVNTVHLPAGLPLWLSCSSCL